MQDFYYTLTAYFNGSESLSPVTDDSNSGSSGSIPGFPGGMGGGMMGGMFSSGDFTLVGYSSDIAMIAFKNGTASVPLKKTAFGLSFSIMENDENIVINL